MSIQPQGSIGSRLHFIIKNVLKTSVKAFAEDVGFKRPDGIYRMKKEENPSMVTLNRIFKKYPQYRKYILEGDTSVLEDDVKEYAKPVDNQLTVNEGQIHHYSKNDGCPFYDYDWGAVVDLIEAGDIAPKEYISIPLSDKDDIFWCKARGKAMLGEIDPGDFIALKELEDFSWLPKGKNYAIVTKNNFKTLRKVMDAEDSNDILLVSTNMDKIKYPNQTIPKDIIDKVFQIVYVIKDCSYE